MRRTLLLVLLALSCDWSSSRAPLRIGSKADDSVTIAEAVAQRLESAGCTVERKFRLGTTLALDRALRAGEIDAYVESHAAALTQVLRQKEQAGPAAETAVRIAYVKANLVWAPPIGIGDYAVVFRKNIDERCRAASRT